jgi:hypothetical protein
MPTYATQTTVSVAKSKADIENTLLKYGCNGFLSGWQGTTAMIAFQINGRQVKFLLPMPDQGDREFTHTSNGRVRTKASAYAAWEQACRQRWRALGLVIKAKLEAVECGIFTFEQEFLAHLVAGADGRTVGQMILPQLMEGKTPRLELR